MNTKKCNFLLMCLFLYFSCQDKSDPLAPAPPVDIDLHAVRLGFSRPGASPVDSTTMYLGETDCRPWVEVKTMGLDWYFITAFNVNGSNWANWQAWSSSHFYVQAPLNFVPSDTGIVNFEVILDPQNQYDEINENNNTCHRQIMVKLADIIANNILFYLPCGGLPVYSVSVGQKVYIIDRKSCPLVLIAHYVIYKDQEIFFEGSTSHEIQFPYFHPWIPSKPGSYTFSLIVDDDNNISEINENNNSFSRVLWVTP